MPLPIGVQVAGRAIAYWPTNPLTLLVAWDDDDPTTGHDFELDVYTGDAARPTAVWPAMVVVNGQEITATWSETATAAWGPHATWRLIRDDVTVLAGKMWRDHPQVDDDTPLNPTLEVDLVSGPTVTVTVTVGGVSLDAMLDAIAVETAARTSVDAALLTFLSTEQTARQNADTAINAKLSRVAFETVVAWTDATDHDLFDEIVVTTDGVSTWSKTVAQYGVASSGAGDGGLANRGRWENTAGAGGGNTRKWFVLKSSSHPSNSPDGSVKALLMNHSGAGSNNGQFGLVLGYRTVAGRGEAITVWHDIFVANPRVINVAPWRAESSPGAGDGSTNLSGGLNWTFRPVLDPRFRTGFTRCWRVGATSYFDMENDEHGLIVGDTVVSVGPPTMITFSPGTVTSVSGARIGVTGILGSRDSLAGGTGYLQKVSNPTPFPYYLEGELFNGGTLVRVRCWPSSQPTPDWSDERYAFTWPVPLAYQPSGVCRFGVFVGHLGPGGGKFHESGVIVVRSK